MKIGNSAKIYAKALIKTNIDSEIILSNFDIISSVVKSSSDFFDIMQSPIVDVKIKKEIIDDIFNNKININVLNFLKILVEKDRFSEILQIIDVYKDEVDKINDIKHVKIISAVDLNDNQKKRIVSTLQNKLSKTIIPHCEVDESIIAGLIVKVDDDIFDDSLKNKLDKICNWGVYGNY